MTYLLPHFHATPYHGCGVFSKQWGKLEHSNHMKFKIATFFLGKNKVKNITGTVMLLQTLTQGQE